MKICTLSDLHGYLPEISPCDLVLICGDSVPLNVQSNTTDTKAWYKNVFKSWADNLPCDKVIFIAGNHELRFPNHYDYYNELFPDYEKITYLMHEGYVYEGLKIFGTPYCKQFGNWAFMLSDDKLDKKFSEIPEDLDILITHDVPYGYADILLQEDCPWADGSHIGNKPLATAILRTQPKYHFSGHLHSCTHELVEIGNTKHYNVSIKDERYNPVYEPLYIEL